MDLIIYHNACTDGFAAAYIAHKKWPKAAVLAQDYGAPLPLAEVKDKDVLVVDFSWDKRHDNVQLSEIARSFQIFDHHKMAKETLAGLDFATFDVTRSGAGITWDELFGKEETVNGLIIPGSPRPWWVNYVEDRDLWHFNLPRSRAVNAYIGTIKQDFRVWGSMVTAIPLEKAMQFGAGAVRQIEQYVRSTVAQAQIGKLFFVDEEGFVHEYSVAVTNAQVTNFSEVGEELNRSGIDIALNWFERVDGVTQFGLRSDKIKNNIDVGKLAKAKNGGGHKTAAGFEMSIEEGRALIDAILGRPLGGESAKVFYAPMTVKELDK